VALSDRIRRLEQRARAKRLRYVVIFPPDDVMDPEGQGMDWELEPTPPEHRCLISPGAADGPLWLWDKRRPLPSGATLVDSDPDADSLTIIRVVYTDARSLL
jgi:hypothetical protein